MNMIDSVKCCFSKYATFEGKASRSEFWWFTLFYLILLVLGITLDGNWIVVEEDPLLSPTGPWEALVTLGLFIPTIAVGCRRLHGIGKSGWWQLIAITGIGYIFLIYWWCQESHS